MKQIELSGFLKFLGVVVFTIFSLTGHGQAIRKSSVSGSVVDSITKTPVEFASVAVYQKSDSSLIAGMITDAKGGFSFDLPPAAYFLNVSFIGYQPKTIHVDISSASAKENIRIELSNSAFSINEVLIEGEKVEKRISIEKTSIDVSQNIAASSGSITDVLKSQASITIDADNNVYLRGNSNILILLDGRPTTVTSLDAMPSANVENIEIITNPDAKYDAEGTAGIINIVTKKQHTSGFNGAITANYGFNNRMNFGVGLNYKKNKWSFGFNYNAKLDKPEIKSTLVREIYSLETHSEQDVFSSLKNPTHSTGMSVSYVPNKKNQILLSIKSVIFDNLNNQSITGTQLIADTLESNFERLNRVTWKRRNIDGSLSYKKIFTKSTHELSFDVMYSLTKGARTGDYLVNDIYSQKSDAGGRPQNTTAQVDYFRPMFGNGRFETGLKFFSRWNSFYSHFYEKDSLTENWLINVAFSNDLEYAENIYSSYLMFSDSLSKKMFFKAGARLEYSMSELYMTTTGEKIRNDYSTPFPFLLFKYQLNKAQSLSASLTRRVTRPVYSQLNPYIIVIDQITYETGNRYLKPETVDKLEINYSLIKEKFQFRNNVFFSLTNNYITQVSALTDEKLVVTYANGDHQTKMGLDMDATYKLSSAFSINAAYSLFYTQSDGYFGSTSLYSNGTAWSGNLKLNYKPNKRTDFQMLFSYSSPIWLPQFRLNEIYYSDFSVKRYFLNNKLALSLTLSDIFNTRQWVVSTENASYNLYNKSKNDSRILWVGIVFNFNSYKPANGKSNDPENDNGIIKLGQ